MKIVAIIPARGGSKGIPNKNVKNFYGKPLMTWTIEQALNSKLIQETYITSDSHQILSIADDIGVQTILRPKELSDDGASSESAILHALDSIKNQPDLIVFLQVTSPLRKKDDIDCAIQKLFDDKADSLLSLCSSKEFIWEKSDKRYLPITYDMTNRCDHRNLKSIYYENGSIYIFKPEILKKYNNRLGGKISAYIMESWQKADIDDQDSFDYCLLQFKKYNPVIFGKKTR